MQKNEEMKREDNWMKLKKGDKIKAKKKKQWTNFIRVRKNLDKNKKMVSKLGNLKKILVRINRKARKGRWKMRERIIRFKFMKKNNVMGSFIWI